MVWKLIPESYLELELSKHGSCEGSWSRYACLWYAAGIRKFFSEIGTRSTVGVRHARWRYLMSTLSSNWQLLGKPSRI